MKEVVIVGNGSYSNMIRNYLEQTKDCHVLAYAVDAEYIWEKETRGIPVLSFEELKEKFPCNKISLVMGIGYKKMGMVRKEIFEKCKMWGYQFENYIHPTALIAKDVVMGEGNNILEGVILETGTVIGDANLFFGGSMAAHETVIGSYNTFSVKAVVAGCAVVHDQCFLGASSVVRDHITLKSHVLIGAAAFAFQDMESYSVVVPAKSMILEGRKSTEFF